MLKNLDLIRPAFLNRIAQAVQRAHAGITAPGEDHLFSAARANHLIVDDIRGHADQRQVTLLLADHFVTGGKRNQVGKTFHGHGGAVLDVARYRVMQAEKLGHDGCLLAVSRMFVKRT